VDCQDDWCVYLPHLLPQRPLAGEKGGPVDTTYRYAAVRQEYPKPHSGVELQAPAGEVVMAAAAGKVVVAGDDKSVRYGYVRNFYGRLVILEHDLPFTGGPVFTLYAHLSRIDVAPGDMVEAGQPIGLVGAAGRAIGPHLHFEVRMGDSSLKSTRNPELWLPAGPGSNPATGILAGSIRDQDGDLCPVDTIVLQPVAESGEPAGEVVYLYTYQGTWWNADGFYQENFAAGGLPAGRYQVSFIYWGQVWKSLVEVFPARVTMVKLVVSPPG
jgi:hypothetical protein